MVPQGHVGGEGEDRDEDGGRGPEVHTQSIQVLAATQTPQFTLSAHMCTHRYENMHMYKYINSLYNGRMAFQITCCCATQLMYMYILLAVF